MDKELRKLDTSHEWVTKQQATVAELYQRLNDYDAEYKSAVATLVGV